VILASNLMAMLIQTLSAKLGIATGMNLAEVCRERFPRSVSFGLWIQAEVIAMATDLAEFIGAALGLHLIFGIPLFPAALITGVFAFGILGLQARGFRPLEAAIAGLVGVILVGFAFQVVLAEPSGSGIASGLAPRFSGSESVLLAVGILGATVMPHVIWLHSALTQRRVVGKTDEAKKRILRFERVDVIIAMTIAGLINMSMLVTAAAVFHARGLTEVADLDDVFDGLGAAFSSHADIAFGIALLASGLSSSSVGTLAGQVVMQGFIRRQIPLFLRRFITMIPALVVIAFGVNATSALVVSQVVLSFGIPFALIPLVLFSRDRSLMGALVNRRVTTLAASVVAALIIALNVVLLYLTFFG
jgi:manganese transport protein